jgi:uncharacterized protein (DUF169 family)
MTSELQAALGLSKPPIAIGFLNEAPEGVAAWSGGAVPAGCSFWRAAMDGQTFYTVPSDHYNCAVGAYTHGITLPALNDTVGFMVHSGYLQMKEVPSIPVLPQAPAFVAYSPVNGTAKFPVDLVVIAARPASAMLIYEAALRGGAGDAVTQSLGRPACAVLPLSLKSGMTSVSFGCKGNRTFTGLPDEELYLAVPGAKWDALVTAAAEIVAANGTMGAHYSQHKAAILGA